MGNSPIASVLENSSSRAYEHLLVQLHHLMADGKSESEEANSVRDEMDVHWQGMSSEDQGRLANLSGDLYFLSEGGPEGAALTPSERQNWQCDVQAAYQGQDWERFLSLVRQPPGDVPRHQILFLLSRNWERLGFAEAAVEFMTEAARLDSSYSALAVLLLDQVGSKEAVNAEVERILRDCGKNSEKQGAH